MNKKDLEEIIFNNKTENKNIDYKLTLDWKDKNKQADIIRDILAMANTQDGGKIIIGFEDETFNLIGINEEGFKSLDNTDINQCLNNYTDPEFNIQLYKFNDFNNKMVAVIVVPEYQEIPIICKKDFSRKMENNSVRYILKQGEVYIRTLSGKTTTVSTSDLMREFLLRAITKKSDSLLTDIRTLLRGETKKPKDKDKDIYNELINNIKQNSSFYKKFIENIKDIGFWEIISYPAIYNSDRLNLKDVFNTAENSVVSKRGESFPFIGKEYNDLSYSNTSEGFECLYLTNTKYNKEFQEEFYSFSKNGLFLGHKLYNEDTDKYYKELSQENKYFSFIEVIFSITEILLFFQRFYEKFMDNSEDLYFEINLNSCNHRYLGSLGTPRYGVTLTKSNQDLIKITRNIKILDLKTDFENLAIKIIQEIFYIFNSEIGEEAIRIQINNFIRM